MPHSATAPSFDVFAPGHLGELTQLIPPEMVDAALEIAGGREQRLRRLPSRVVVYLLLAGALFAGQGWQHVWSRMTAGLATPVVRLSSSSLSAAMRRVGVKPLRELFTFLTGATGIGTRQAVRFAGRLVVAIDGTQIAVPDTEMNRVLFPKPRGGPNGQAGYPMIRLVAILQAGTRRLVDAVFGSDKTGELTYASRLVTALKPGMLLLGDRNFSTYQFFTSVTDTGAEFLIRGKTGNGAMKLPINKRLHDGSYLATAAGIPVRVILAMVTITTEAGARTGEYRFVTTLLDPHIAPAERLARLYHDRWEIETAYCELKSTILGGRVLRGRYPAAVTQEVWALLSAYQVLRTAMADAALSRPDIEPSRLSFTTALLSARDQIIQASHAITQTRVDLVGRIGAAVLTEPIPARRTRTRPRVIKRAISKYRAKGPNIDHHTYPATLHTRILTPSPDG
ncbi:MAG: IS4 family transposase [Microbacteriaceae bacterium]|nr:MAG: IS4 family transposase [Microbacteriaceae bacterium]